MKSLRVWLLVLLTVLLPLRGALAAAMICPLAQAGARAQAHHHVHQQVQDADSVHDPAAHGGGHPHEHAGNTPGKCNACSAFCSVTGLADRGHSVAAPLDATTVFPNLSAPRPTFLSDRQERPPRSS